ncbi:heme exporter protein CcmB [Jiulongibacter sediminis]|uniref:ABC transporter permease n=1 Tax=Jiulongibacter sediminis TaxID=1605367 RepID=A0A0P7BWY7_9BACT|nr:heme exporter protein CcmB [Jiulongibacter sediminis]KPM49121.1 ABC transporter permease [Jiulongibacter sediminis]TBX26180.1 ABC transporter permease [Jiulongibacter sediminis]
MREILALLQKDITLEWRNKYAFNGMILYLVSTVFICFLSFRIKANSLSPVVWNTLFWIIILFTAINAMAKSFAQENQNRQAYYFTLASPEAIIISKLIYNFILMLFLAVVGFGIYLAFLQNPVQDMPMYILSVVLGALGFSGTLTLISGIASKAENTTSIMALLSFPIIIPMLLMLMRLSKNAMDGLAFSVSQDEILTLLGLDAIVLALSFILFPFLWRS